VTAYYKSKNTFIKVNILSTPAVDNVNDYYAIQDIDSGDILEVLATKLIDHNPNIMYVHHLQAAQSHL
jgi:hypothetical protein